jgi:hypothetical protein
MRFGNILRFMTSENPDRKNIRGNKYLFRDITAETPEYLSACLLFPSSSVIVTLFIPFLKL